MEEISGAPDLLDLMVQPGFYVENFIIVRLNPAAEGLLLQPGMDIRPLIESGLEEYQTFQEGCLYLRLRLHQKGIGASVIKQNGADTFLLDTQESDSALQALSLAARELRDPLASIIVSTSALQGENEQLALLNRGIHQMLRIIGNMSDAATGVPVPRMEMVDADALFREVLEKTGSLARFSEVKLTYEGLEHPVSTLADSQALERAALNMLSNALKYTPAGGEIRVSLSRRGRILCFSVSDSGPGIPENVMPELFRRYLRQPAIEDGRNGMGLGMVLIRSAAAAHGGTVLVDRKDGTGTRVTLTIAIRQGGEAMLRSNVLRVDYAGEQDHAMIELSDVLPASRYETKN